MEEVVVKQVRRQMKVADTLLQAEDVLLLVEVYREVVDSHLALALVVLVSL